MLKKFLSREIYLNKLLPFVGTDLIKVITGQRRVGKSFILFQLMDEIRKKDPSANILYINKELYEFDHLNTYRDLMEHIKSHKQNESLCYIFIDEIQDIADFEKALRSLQAEGGYDIYCTGSNAKLLSGELSTFLSGRYIEVHIYSLTYREFLAFHNLEDTVQSFNKFIRFGGLPYLRNLKLDENIAGEYLKSIYNTIILKDVVERNNIRNVRLLQDLTVFLADNIGSQLSANKIAAYLKSQQINVSTKQILDYLGFLCNAFMVQCIKRADIAGKKIFEIGEKYYYEDLGIRHALVPFRNNDIGKIMENMVAHQLIVNGYQLYVGKLQDKEIDFIAEKNGERLYIQVAYQINLEKTQNRELGNLLDIQDNYPKIIITMDEWETDSTKGIIYCSLRNWLMNFSDGKIENLAR